MVIQQICGFFLGPERADVPGQMRNAIWWGSAEGVGLDAPNFRGGYRLVVAEIKAMSPKFGDAPNTF